MIALVVLLPLALSRVPGMSALLGVQLAQPLADVCTFACAVPLSVSVLRAFGADAPASDMAAEDGETETLEP